MSDMTLKYFCICEISFSRRRKPREDA